MSFGLCVLALELEAQLTTHHSLLTTRVNISVISSPYYLGHRDVGMGAGPTAFVNGGAVETLRDSGHDVSHVTLDFDGSVDHEVGATFAVNTLLAGQVRRAVGSGAFPIVLSGNCCSCVGTLAGLGLAEVAVAWFDAHGDFNSPDTTGSGFFDGMGLHIATGNSWRTIAATVEGFRPVAERNVILAGVRDLDGGEQELIESSAITTVDYATLKAEGIAGGLAAPLDAVSSRIRDLYLHVDIDVLDPVVAPANEYQPAGGLRLEELSLALEMIGDRFQVRAAALACYNPAVDGTGIGCEAGLEVLRMFGDIGWGP